MARRQTTQTRGHAGSKLLTLLAVALLIYWAGRDPAGAAALTRHLSDAITAATHHGRTTTP